VLCFAIAWFNFLDPAVNKAGRQPEAAKPSPTLEPAGAAIEATEAPAATQAPVETEAPAATEASEADRFDSDAPLGHEVGQQLPDFTLSCYDGSTFHLAEQRGKVTIINLWATYCTPCKQELPHFSELYRAHEGDIAMIAVHPSLVTDDPEAYISDKGYAMPFATDADDAVIALVGGTGTLPQTIVLNRRGEVIYNTIGSVTPEVLDALYEEANG